MSQYADKLTEGHKALLKTYKDYFHQGVSVASQRRVARSASTTRPRRIATTANLAPGGNGVTGAAIGIPFPIPKEGVEVFWNHVLRYRADAAQRMHRAGAGDGKRRLHDGEVQGRVLRGLQPRRAPRRPNLDNVILYFIQETIAPARLAGEILLVHETLDQSKENRRAWVYNPGQRRVRRAPNVAFDNPGTNADNLRTSDQFDMYNGSPERYTWKLVGKKEMYVPYNSYKLHSNQLKYTDILKPQHINQDLARYELHRVWVVDSMLKPGTSHVYKRRTLYVDEDSWQILAVDCYDTRDQLWRVQEGHAIEYYDVPSFWTTLELVMDLQNRRYLALGLDNEEPRTYDFHIKRTVADYQVSALRSRGTR